MAYYNREGKRLDIREENLFFLGEGYQAKVFHDGKRAFKQYKKRNYAYSAKISLTIFDYLKELHHPNLFSLDDVFCKLDDSSFSLFRSGIQPFRVDGYTSKYYAYDSTNVLLAPTDYLLDNFRELDRLIERFSKDRILTFDLGRRNVILDPNNIILIDPDEFCEVEGSRSLSFDNKSNLLRLFEDICRDGLFRSLNVSLEKFYALFDITIQEDMDIAYELSKKIGTYSRPIDYLKQQ